VSSTSQRSTIWPPVVRAGDTVRIVAPSGAVPAERLERGVRVLRRALEVDVTFADNVAEQEGYFAGTDAARIASLHEAFTAEGVRAIFCARGGYGATRLLASLDPQRLRDHPRLLVGFSDITALACWAWVRAGLPSLHGPVVTQLSTLHPDHVQRMVDWVHGEIPAPLEATEGAVIHGGTVEGTLVAGNLEVLRALIGTRYFPPLAGNILALEEVGEQPYRIDRSLTQLLASGVLRGVRGVVIGQLRSCDAAAGAIGPTAAEVVHERLGTLGVPVATGFEFGHDDLHNAALPFGAVVRLRADDCTLDFLEPIVR
jgi:muramoyltetrapeptide carboxypeptidase